MVYINPSKIAFKQSRVRKLQSLTKRLVSADASDRNEIVEEGRAESWGNKEIVNPIKKVVGNKCWYSEVYLDHNDPNIDHFRPKGSIREIDTQTFEHKHVGPSYWWLAFEPKNFRLAAMHANQRRVDATTAGGKANYFPVRGPRAAERTPWSRIKEDALPLDPCSKTDIRLLWFDPDGNPGPAERGGRPLSENDQERVRVSIWLYHLDKEEIRNRRGELLRGVLADLDDANDDFVDWDADGACNLKAKRRFDKKIEAIHRAIHPESLFAGAADRVVRSSSAHYTWITDYLL